MIPILSHEGISVWRVTNPSRNAAVINTGTSPTTIFSPRRAPCRNDSRRDQVPGKRRLFPMTMPAVPAIIIAAISNVPCIQMDKTEVSNNPFW